MSRFVGVLALLLGLTGVVVCAAGIGLSWWASFEYLGRVVQGMRSAEERIDRAKSLLGKTQDRVREAGVRVAALQTTAVQLAEAGTPNEPAGQVKLDALLEGLSARLDQVEFVEASLQPVVEVLGDLGELSAEWAGDPQQGEKLRSAAEALDETLASLPEVRQKLAAAKLATPQARAQLIRQMGGLLQSLLSSLDGAVGSLGPALDELRGEVASFRERVEFWRVAGPALLTLILVWIGAGQWCMIVWGWGRLRPAQIPA